MTKEQYPIRQVQTYSPGPGTRPAMRHRIPAVCKRPLLPRSKPSPRVPRRRCSAYRRLLGARIERSVHRLDASASSPHQNPKARGTRKFADSLLKGTGFETAVPRKAGPVRDHSCRPCDGFRYPTGSASRDAEPMVRILLPPGTSLRTIGPTAAFRAQRAAAPADIGFGS
jgi:hypothetical protein